MLCYWRKSLAVVDTSPPHTAAAAAAAFVPAAYDLKQASTHTYIINEQNHFNVQISQSSAAK